MPTSLNLANALVKLVAVDALPALVGELVVANLVGRQMDAPFTPSTLGAIRVAEEAFAVPDVTKVIAVPDLLRLYMYPAISKLAEAIETDLLRLYRHFPIVPAGNFGEGMSEEAASYADSRLFGSRSRASNNGYLVVTNSAYRDLRRCDRFREYQNAGDAGLRRLVDGSVGRLFDLFVFRSQFVNKSVDGVANNLAFNEDAIGLSIKRLPRETGPALTEYSEHSNYGLRVVMDYKPDTLQQTFRVAFGYCCGPLDTGKALVLQS